MRALWAGRRPSPRAGTEREGVVTDRLQEGAVGSTPHDRGDEESRSGAVGSTPRWEVVYL
jgi:hypothetical protein